MIMGMFAAQMRVASGIPWTPLNMATVPQIYLDAHDSVVTDVSGACSAISNLGAMGSAGDFSQSTSARRPAIIAAELNGKRILRLDGTDDWLECNTAEVKDIFRAKAAAWSFVVYKKRTADASPINKVLLHFVGATGAARFTHWCGSATTGKANTPFLSYNVTAFASVEGGTASSGAYVISSADVNAGAGTVSLHRNGTLDASSTLTSGAFPDTSASGGAFPVAVLGARGDAVWMPDIDFASAVVGNTPLSSEERQRLEGWAAHKYGLTASLPGGHPYKTVAPTI